MKPVDDINKSIQKLRLKASADLDKRVHDGISEVLAESEKTESAVQQPNIWRTIMKSPITKLAAAAVIIIAVLVVINNIDSSSIALAAVLEKVEQTRAYMYTVKMKITGNMLPSAQEQTTTTIVSDDYGRKSYLELTDPNTGKTTTQESYILLEQKMIVTIMLEKKQYMRMPFNDEFDALMKQQNNDPREIIKKIMACEYTELGRSVIDGVEVQGFRTTDPAAFSALEGWNPTSTELTLWVDAENWLPFRSERDIKYGEKKQITAATYDYRWNVPVQASDFDPVIPEDFKPFPGGMKMPSMNEEGAIEGLSRFAEMTGKYPKTLNILELKQEITADNQYLKDQLRKFHDQMSDEIPKDERFNALKKKGMEIIQPLQSIFFFYMMLVADKKEPVYYGESVGPDDADKVLLKWKVSEDHYRVIFGDLTAEDLTTEQWNEFEK